MKVTVIVLKAHSILGAPQKTQTELQINEGVAKDLAQRGIVEIKSSETKTHAKKPAKKSAGKGS